MAKLCPSAQPDSPEAKIFIRGDRYLPLPVVGEKAGGERVRYAAPCQASCHHFQGSCRLARRIVAYLPVVSDSPPACSIRWACRWFSEHGKSACFRCPQVITENANPTELWRYVAGDPNDQPWFWLSLLRLWKRLRALLSR